MAKDYLIAALAQAIGVAAAGAVTIIIARLLGPARDGANTPCCGARPVAGDVWSAGFLARRHPDGQPRAVPSNACCATHRSSRLSRRHAGSLRLVTAYALAPDGSDRPPVRPSSSPSSCCRCSSRCQFHTALLFALQRPRDLQQLFIVQQLVWVATAAVASGLTLLRLRLAACSDR